MSAILFTVEIEIKPYLKKFLMSKSVNKQEPLRFPRKHDYNVLLLKLITNYYSLKSIHIEDHQNVINYFKNSKQKNAEKGISLILPFNDRKDVRSYNYLSVSSKKIFRKEVRSDFYFEFSRYLIHNLKHGKRRVDVIKEFMEYYNLTEDDIKTETLYRYSSRLLKELSI